MMKITTLIEAPVLSNSGYGAHSRDIAYSIIKQYPDWNIIIAPTQWGGCSSIDFENEQIKTIKEHLIQNPLEKQPDVFIQVTIPGLFNPIGRYNIGITAGIETTLCHYEWLEGCNKMDLIIVPSTFAKNVFMNSSAERKDTRTNQTIEVIKAYKPIEVIFEGIDTNVYKKTKDIVNVDLKKQMDSIPEDFVFLYLGHWLSGDLFHDRKDTGGLIKSFLETFAGKENKPSLLLKTNGASPSNIDKTEILKKIELIKKLVNKEDLPNIYLLHGQFTDDEINQIYNHDKIKSLVSYTHGEGYSRPFAEFGSIGKLLIVPNWSGHLDFVTTEGSVLLDGTIRQVHPSVVWEKIIIPESGWFYVDYEKASKRLMGVFENYGLYLEKSRKQRNNILNNYTLEHMDIKLKEVLDKYIPKFNIEIPKLNLPKLKKVE
ncbi:MAG: hypothetical protein M0R17_13285 [Candidatus Omnitrophica bacterium]|nr:hypothetical protein [Candidatus Omnitrophota bacterium]